jgi:hypothetical protein
VRGSARQRAVEHGEAFGGLDRTQSPPGACDGAR